MSFQRHSHPLKVNSSDLYTIVNGQIAQNEVNVHDALLMGEKQVAAFHASLASGFHAKKFN